jgi:transcriptional regulator GlxA family with amidase domain
MPSSTPRRIVFAVYDGVALLDLSGPLDAFRIASEFALKEHRKTYECVIVSSLGGRIRTASGVDLNTGSVRSLAEKPIDTLPIPGAFFCRGCDS